MKNLELWYDEYSAGRTEEIEDPPEFLHGGGGSEGIHGDGEYYYAFGPDIHTTDSWPEAVFQFMKMIVEMEDDSLEDIIDEVGREHILNVSKDLIKLVFDRGFTIEF